MTTSAIAFAALAAVLTVTPGIDTAFMLRLTAGSGKRAGFLAIAGICSGLWVWGLLSVLGIATLVRTSATAFDVLRLAGAAYIVWLGATALASGLRRASPALDADPPQPRSPYLAGLATNVLNPKIGVFYVSVLPEFIPHGAAVVPSTLLLVGIHTLEGALWLGLLVLMLARMRGLLERPAVRSRMEVVAGLSLIGFGLALVFERP